MLMVMAQLKFVVEKWNCIETSGERLSINHSVLTYKWFPCFRLCRHLFSLAVHMQTTDEPWPHLCRMLADCTTREWWHTKRDTYYTARWYIKFTFLVERWMRMMPFIDGGGAKDFQMISTRFVSVSTRKKTNAKWADNFSFLCLMPFS